VHAIFDILALTAICCINFFVSNWHNLQLKRSQETALVEDRAILLAQVSHDMRQPIHALSMLNGLVDDALVAHLDQGTNSSVAFPPKKKTCRYLGPCTRSQ
jgi:signal transduction histidine kinase